MRTDGSTSANTGTSQPADEPDERSRSAPSPSLMDELYALLKESVKLRLVSDVPLGAFLSGGIDSSTIVGLMRELGASPLRTFSIGFKDASYNELDHARRIARRFETEHEELIIEPRALELTEKLVRHLDEPLGDFSIFPTYLVSEMARAPRQSRPFGGRRRRALRRIRALPGPEASPGSRRRRGRGEGRRTGHAPAAARRARKRAPWNKLRRFTQAFDNEHGLRHLRWMMFLSDARQGGALLRTT